ncbi:hypothetical protein KM043_002727 [Ampulex compressa]|nr:hypothetical protein KM043_002727 [Ampulex compressa]
MKNQDGESLGARGEPVEISIALTIDHDLIWWATLQVRDDVETCFGASVLCASAIGDHNESAESERRKRLWAGEGGRSWSALYSRISAGGRWKRRGLL